MNLWSCGPTKQQGAIMVVSLLLLLVMTVLALTASQSTTLQERMAGNARDVDLAFQAAEAGLRDAEATLAGESIASDNGMPQACAISEPCDVKQRNISFKPDFSHAEDFWKDNTRQYGGDEKQLGEVTSDPQVFTENHAIVPDSIRAPAIGVSATAYYAHTVRAKGGTDSATVVLQSMDAVRVVTR